MTDSRLVQSGRIGEENLDKLRVWLSYHGHSDDFSANSFDLIDLHAALRMAQSEIVENLDPQLRDYIDRARGPEYKLDVNKEEMYATRTIEWNSFSPQDVISWDEKKTIEYLRSARDEIRWLSSKVGGLRVHMANAKRTKETS